MRKLPFCLVLAIAATPALAQDVTQKVGVCDPTAYVHSCLKPASDGSEPVTISAGSAIIGNVRIDQTTPGTTNGVVVNSSALPTGAATSANQSAGTAGSASTVVESVQGIAGGTALSVSPQSPTKVVTVTPTITASSAYASGNNVGSTMTFTNQGRASGGSGLVQMVTLQFADAQSTPTDIILFNAAPANTYTDKTAVAMTTDVSKVIGVVHISDCTTLGTASTCQAIGLAIPYALNATQNMYGQLVTRGTPTFGSTSDVTVAIKTLND